MLVKVLLLSLILGVSSVPVSHSSFAAFRRGNRYFNYLMGRYYMNTGNFGRAAQYLEAVLVMNPGSETVTRELLDIYYTTGQYGRALTPAAKMYGFRPDDPFILELYADVLTKNRLLNRAREVYSELLRIDPGNSGARLSLAALHVAEDDYKAALSQYLRILRRDRADLYARLSMADLYLKLGKTRAAASHYLETLKYGAEPVEIYGQVARIHYRRGSKRRALRSLYRALEHDPENKQITLMISEIHQSTGDMEKAEEMLLNLLKIYPESYTIMLKLGIHYAENKEDAEEAEKMFKRLTELYPYEFVPWHFLGLIKEHLGKYESAKEALIKAINLRETDQAYFILGVVYDKLDMHEESYEAFSNCIELNPEHAAAKNYLGYIWADRGKNLEEAKQLILGALEIDPDNAAYIDSLGWVYYQLSRYDEALEQLKLAASKMSDPIILEHLGDTYMKLDDPESAVTYYRKALEKDPENETLLEKLESFEK